MISNRPYLIRALFEWIVDNGWTPHLQVDANYPWIEVPQEFAKDGMIVLNVHPEAVRALEINNDLVTFKARFGGVERKLNFPPEAVLAIFARENGQGMPFPPEAYPTEENAGEENTGADGSQTETSSAEDASKTSSDKAEKAKKRSHLSVVK
ncbi:MAG: ClpXP protease specificity-enhancing factor [Hydrogenovibrio sp.]|uniref:ClpXP protease specificity-enhancing factor n=1 Tax=Hydrogenovibrio sp. TaxID=2065821 RepID=UPI0028708251|nr:ClpXP protease specificity-enhancing factor [Hydrogenovibrio sp.]MDR9498482.1 ClpXP protease specificity-enhancing factor [Hydrogenovibrio sp.]